jgi:anthranilate synthase component II
MNEDVIILDFFDSFTYNIANEVAQRGLSVSVHQNPYKVFSELLKTRKKKILVLGPGPGHPDDYHDIFPLIKKLFQNKHLHFLGVCLGHQIIWRIKGDKVVKSENPIHGRAVPFKIPPWKEFFDKPDWGHETMVQRYNSLTVIPAEKNIKDFSFSAGEVMAGKFERGLTYQFHPESVGTINSKIFFEPLKKILCK